MKVVYSKSTWSTQVDLCSSPFCLFTPMAAGVIFPFHSLYFGKVTYAAAGKDRLLISCWLGFLWTLDSSHLFFIKVTYELWESRVRLLKLGFGIFRMHFVKHIFLSLNSKFYLNPLSLSGTVIPQSSANFVSAKSG